MPRESFDREPTKTETWNKTKVHVDDKGAHVEVQNGDCLWQIAHDAVAHQSPDKKAKSHQINRTIDDIKKENPGKVARDGTIHPTSAKGDYLDLPPIFAPQPDNKANKPTVTEQKETPKADQNSKTESKIEQKPASEPEATAAKAPASVPDAAAAKAPGSATETDTAPTKAPVSAPESATQKADIPTGYGAVAGAITSGAVEEITEHPVKVAVIAAGTAVVTGVAAAFVAPGVIVAAGIAGVGYGAYELYEKSADWFKAADVVANGNEHTAEERAKSEKELKAIGAGTVDLAAGGIGGLAKGAVARTTSSAIGKFTGSATDELVTAASTKIGQSTSPFDLGKKLPDEIAAMPLGKPRSEAIRNMVDPPVPEATAANSAASGGSKALVDTHLPAAIRDLPPSPLKSAAVRTYVEGQELPANKALLDRSLPKEIMDLPPARRAELIRAMAGDGTPAKATGTANDALTLTSEKAATTSQSKTAIDAAIKPPQTEGEMAPKNAPLAGEGDHSVVAPKPVLPPAHWPEGIVDKVEAPVPPGQTRLYRGVSNKGLEGEFKVPLNEQEGRRLDELLMDPNIDAKGHAELLKLVERRKGDGKYYSDYKDTALEYAGADGKLLYVDIPTREAASYSVAAGMMPDGKGGGSFYVPYQRIRNAHEHAQSPTNHLTASVSRSSE